MRRCFNRQSIQPRDLVPRQLIREAPTHPEKYSAFIVYRYVCTLSKIDPGLAGY